MLYDTTLSYTKSEGAGEVFTGAEVNTLSGALPALGALLVVGLAYPSLGNSYFNLLRMITPSRNPAPPRFRIA